MRTPNRIKWDLLFKILTFGMMTLCHLGKASSVFRAPVEKNALKNKLAWAEAELGVEKESGGIWIGYAIEKWMQPPTC